MTTRNTVQKRVIREQLHALGNHPTVDEVYGAVRNVRPTISKATVYRVLRGMADTGDALRVPVVDGAERFDHRTDPHFHVVCETCGHVEDVEESALGGIDWRAAQGASGFAITGYELQFRGICPACAAKGDARGRGAEVGSAPR
jgi:Fe2+ or Zn2+ uptake regulation protein